MIDLKSIVQRFKKAASSKKAIFALCAVCFLEPMILPLFPEIIIAPILLSRPHEQLKTLLIAISMTLLGSCCAYILSFFFGKFIIGMLSPIVTDIETIMENMAHYGTYLPFLGSLIPMPYKVVCLSCGLLKISFSYFFFGVLLGRATRYSLLLLLPKKKTDSSQKTLPYSPSSVGTAR